ncbi:MAG: hypothetical protein WC054_00800 [Candidatus Nanopelagicales bacterium]
MAAQNRSRGTRYLAVDFASRRITHEFKFADVGYTFQNNVAGEFGATLDLYDPNTRYLKAQETYLVVERLGKPFWCGFLWQPTRSGKNLNVVAQEVWSIFGHRRVRQTLDWINQDRGFMLRNLLTYAQMGPAGDLGVSIGSETVGGPPQSYKVPWWENKGVVETAETLLKMNPAFSFRIEGEWQPGNVLGFRLVIDAVHPIPTPHRLIYGGNVDDYDWTPLSPSPNFVDGFGGFDNEAMLRRTAQNDDALARQPRIESSIENRELLGDEGVLNLAVNQLKRLSGSPSQPSVTMQAGSDPVLGVLRPGHQCHVSIDDGYVHVDGDFSVEKITVSVPNGSADSPGAETVKIDFESKLDDTSVSTT